MAGGIGLIKQLPGKVNASNALVVSGDTGAVTGGTAGAIGNLAGTIASGNKLVVVFT